jgi:manganese/zinc/iron transport system permease protein
MHDRIIIDALPAFAFDFVRVFTLQDYNTRVVLIGTLLLGVASGIVGTFTLLRRQALVGDVVSHAALPGVAIAFLAGELISPGSGRSLTSLLIGASIFGLLAVVCVNLIRRFSFVKPDAALATALGVFFGLGAVLFKVVEQLPSGNQAGLNQFIFGSAATMTRHDVELISLAALGSLILVVVLFKEFSQLSFDEDYAAAQGWPVLLLDVLLTGLVVAVTVIGLQSVGLLMVALLITPPTAARFWTERLGAMTLIAAAIGGASAAIGTLASASVPKLAGGPTIVLTGTGFFVISLLFGTHRGIVHKWIKQRGMNHRIGRVDLLRAMYEIIESHLPETAPVTPELLTSEAVQTDQLLKHRSWTPKRLRGLIALAESEGVVRIDSESGWRLTRDGGLAARQAVRNHRLWETFLITHADIAPSHVDRDADSIEHVLDRVLIEQLERLLAERNPHEVVPRSPHPTKP